ncbi:MAG: lipopolysaccharide heptosyltransferase II [Candidatus Omnitrophota bacterium]|jgi:lipopolysaccharide heptosyltransferase II|nr:MAG: lipopolysaccharide heptosyltransferase II [Candidatus Omnitrophota bacterium]
MTKRILIFNVNWLGDVLFSTAVIRNLKRNYPDSYIACCVPGRCLQIIKGNPHLDEIIIYDERGKAKGLMPRLKFINMLKTKKFDTVYLLHRSFSRALMCRLAGIPERIGYHTKKRAFLLTKAIKQPKKDSMHRIDYYLNILKESGLACHDRHTEFTFDDMDMLAVGNFFKENDLDDKGLLIAINPGGNWLPKRWPKENWAKLADLIISELKAKVIITGGSQDLKLSKEIEGLMKNKPVISVDIFNLKQLGALLSRIPLFITADSGPLHIASSVGCRNIIAIFGPTSASVTGPVPGDNTLIIQKDVGCKIPCYEVKCPDNRCMKAITPEEVLKEIKKIYAKR